MYKDRDQVMNSAAFPTKVKKIIIFFSFQFASLVREVAAPDVGRMGIEILSFTIKDVYDNVTYLASLGESHQLWFCY